MLARLGHPYYYVVSLGLVAVISLWLVLFWQGGRLWWRVSAGLLALLTLLAAGSRGPTLALIFGSLAAVLLAGRRGKRRWVLLPLGLVAATVLIVSSFNLPVNPVTRLLSDQTSGRNFCLGRRLRRLANLAHRRGGAVPGRAVPDLPVQGRLPTHPHAGSQPGDVSSLAGQLQRRVADRP